MQAVVFGHCLAHDAFAALKIVRDPRPWQQAPIAADGCGGPRGKITPVLALVQLERMQLGMTLKGKDTNQPSN